MTTELQERHVVAFEWFRSPELNELAPALVAIQAEVGSIPKDDWNPFFKSNYAGLPAVVEKAGPIVTKNGVAVSQYPSFDGANDLLTTLVLHKSGQYIGCVMRLHLAKKDPQGQGSAITYARRYSYMAALGLVADEDDDGNAASASTSANRSSGKPSSSKPTNRSSATTTRQPPASTAAQHSDAPFTEANETLIGQPEVNTIRARLANMEKPITTPKDVKAHVSELVGRTLGSLKELTTDEYKTILVMTTPDDAA